MEKIIDNCVSCGLPCVYDCCPYYKRLAYVCDYCGEEVDSNEAYELDGTHYCKDCLLNTLLTQDVAIEFVMDKFEAWIEWMGIEKV